jgi:protein gp37
MNERGEWGYTFNPWIGCTKVDGMCALCYAWLQEELRYKRVKWGKGQPRVRTSVAYWKQVFEWDKRARLNRTRYRVFCASLADVMDAEVPQRWRNELFDLIPQTPNLDWLLLTKRPENFKLMLPWERDGSAPWRNVWLGTSVGERSARCLKRLKDLQAARVDSVRFLSGEPLLGDLGKLDLSGISWVIAGGESGVISKVRSMELEWVESLKAQCDEQGVAFHFKQLGAKPIYNGSPLVQIAGAGHDLTKMPESMMHLAVKNSPKVSR